MAFRPPDPAATPATATHVRRPVQRHVPRRVPRAACTGLSSLLLVLLVAGLAGPARGEATVALTIPNPEAYVNEPLEVQLIIEDFSVAEDPDWPDIPQATVRLAGTAADMQRSIIINGRRSDSRSRTYRYELVPREVGELLIPPVSVRVDGKVLTTRPQRVRVRPSDADELFIVEIGCGRQRVYIGQRVRLTMRLWIKPPRLGGELLDANAMVQLIQPINFGPFPRQVAVGQQMRDTSSGPQHYYTYEFVTNFIPTRPGPLVLDDIAVGLRYPVRRTYRPLRPAPLFEPTEVLPVPAADRPAGYTGAVGIFDIQVSASPTSVRVGDPIELRIDLFGDGPVETLPAPLFAADPELTAKFRVPTDVLPGELVGGRRRFQATLRALQPDVQEIPPIQYPYFDPDAERFVIARSRPIPLRVTPSERIDVTELPIAAGLPAPKDDVRALDGLYGIYTDPAALLARTAVITPTQVLLVTLAPPAAFLALWGGLTLVAIRRANPDRRRRRIALRTALQRLNEAAAEAQPPAAAAGIHAALCGYLADRTGQPAARYAERAGGEFLRLGGVRGDLDKSWDQLVTDCDRAAFGGERVDISNLADRARHLLDSLERCPLQSPPEVP